jgi:hypothetical protein
MTNSSCKEPSQDCPHATAVAEKAVAKVFATMGVDVANVKDVEQFREDLRFGGALRRVATKGLTAVVLTLLAGAATTTWHVVTHKMGFGE